MLTIFACSIVAGAVDTTSQRVVPAAWLFLFGLLVLATHIAWFIYRSWKKQPKSRLVFWITLALSVPVIPITYIMLTMSAGASCGYGASNGPIFLLVFQVVGITAQMISWRIVNRPVLSPIPLN